MILGDIGDAAVNELVDHGAHFFDILSGARLDVRRQAAERGDIFVELPLGRFRHLGDRFVERQVREVAGSARIDLVVDVGDVADVLHMLRPINVAQEPDEHIEYDDWPRVADMGEVVDGGPADIEAHRLRVDRLKGLRLARLSGRVAET